jgi:predicted thioesterase
MVIALPILILVLVGSLGLLATVLLVKIFEWALYGVFSRLSKH